MFEYGVAQFLKKNGKAAFLTFGTFLDPAKIDIIVLEDLNSKVEIDINKLVQKFRLLACSIQHHLRLT